MSWAAEPLRQFVKRLAGKNRGNKYGNGDAQEQQGIVFRTVPLGEQFVNPGVQESGEDIAFKDTAGKPGQYLFRPLADLDTVQTQEDEGNDNRYSETAITLAKAIGSAAIGGDQRQQA